MICSLAVVRTRVRAAGAAALALALGSAPARSQVSPNGDPFQVNAYTTGSQWTQAVAAGAGAFLVAWASDGSFGTDTDGLSVQAQRYATDGTPLGGQFQVNAYTTGHQRGIALAATGTGGFVVAWMSDGSGGSDTSGDSIQARRYAADGTPLGGQFQVNGYTTGNQRTPAVAADSQGNFVVVWESYGSGGSDTLDYSVQARRYAADGTPRGAQFQVNGFTTNHQRSPGVAVDAQGRFVVAWESRGSSGTDTSYWSIQARRYAADGTPLGGQFQVNTYTTESQLAASVAADPAGAFVVAWMSYGSSGTDTSDYSVQARRYDSGGTAVGGQFQVNTYTTGRQGSPEVAVAERTFDLAWYSDGSNGTDVSATSIQGRRYRASLAPLSGQFQVNTYTTGVQSLPAVASDPAGNFVVAWSSQGSSGSDSDLTSIHARRYDELFRDGLETGSTARWSSAVP